MTFITSQKNRSSGSSLSSTYSSSSQDEIAVFGSNQRPRRVRDKVQDFFADLTRVPVFPIPIPIPYSKRRSYDTDFQR